MHDFQGYFYRTFQVLEFSGKKIQDFPGGVGGKPGTRVLNRVDCC